MAVHVPGLNVEVEEEDDLLCLRSVLVRVPNCREKAQYAIIFITNKPVTYSIIYLPCPPPEEETCAIGQGEISVALMCLPPVRDAPHFIILYDFILQPFWFLPLQVIWNLKFSKRSCLR